jgi:hypothetical protein
VAGRSASAGADPFATRHGSHADVAQRPASLLAGAGPAIGSDPWGIHPCRLDPAACAISGHRPRWQTLHPLLRTDLHLHLPRRSARAGRPSRTSRDRGAGQSQAGARIRAAAGLGARLVFSVPRCAAPDLHAPARDHRSLPAAGVAISSRCSSTRRHGDQSASRRTGVFDAARVSAAAGVGISHHAAACTAAFAVGSNSHLRWIVRLWGSRRRRCPAGDGGCRGRHAAAVWPTAKRTTVDRPTGSYVAGGRFNRRAGAGTAGQFLTAPVARQPLGQHASVAGRRRV